MKGIILPRPAKANENYLVEIQHRISNEGKNMSSDFYRPMGVQEAIDKAFADVLPVANDIKNKNARIGKIASEIVNYGKVTVLSPVRLHVKVTLTGLRMAEDLELAYEQAAQDIVDINFGENKYVGHYYERSESYEAIPTGLQIQFVVSMARDTRF